MANYKVHLEPVWANGPAWAWRLMQIPESHDGSADFIPATELAKGVAQDDDAAERQARAAAEHLMGSVGYTVEFETDEG